MDAAPCVFVCCLMSFVSSVCYVRRSRVIAECGFVPSPCHAGRSVHVGLRRFPFPIGLSAFLSLSIGWSANRWYVGGRSAYMGVPPLFSFLGGSGSGTASGACIELFVGIMTLAGIGETECDMVPYMASDGFWWCPIGCHSIRLGR